MSSQPNKYQVVFTQQDDQNIKRQIEYIAHNVSEVHQFNKQLVQSNEKLRYENQRYQHLQILMKEYVDKMYQENKSLKNFLDQKNVQGNSEDYNSFKQDQQTKNKKLLQKLDNQEPSDEKRSKKQSKEKEQQIKELINPENEENKETEKKQTAQQLSISRYNERLEKNSKLADEIKHFQQTLNEIFFENRQEYNQFKQTFKKSLITYINKSI